MTIPRPIHFQAVYVHAEESEASLIALSSYIRRAREIDVPGTMPVIDRESYMLRREHHLAAQAEVVGHLFVCNGPWSTQEVWRLVEAAARTKSGTYSKRGGRRGGLGSPRLATFADASLPRELPGEANIAIAHEFARLMNAKFGCAVEVACHMKNGVVDHAHFLISMRPVDASGVGKTIREFNGIASRLGPNGVGEERLSGHMEFMRAAWARLLTEATGIEHCGRSYERQGLSVQPLRHVPRARIEIEARQGVAPGRLGWREEHALQKAMRSDIRVEAQAGSSEPVDSMSPNTNDEIVTGHIGPIGSSGDLVPSNAGPVIHEHEAPVHDSAAFHPTGPGRAPPLPHLPQSPSRRCDGFKNDDFGRKSGSDRSRPPPTRVPFKILSEGSPEIAASKDLPASSSASSAQPVNAATQVLSVSHPLVLYGAALLQSRQTTSVNIGRLAGAAAMERSDFERAVRQTADEISDKSAATIKAEVKAYLGSMRPDLLDLLEDIERERRDAKAAARKKADAIRAESHRSTDAGKETPSDGLTDNAATLAAPSRFAQTAETVATADVAAGPSPITAADAIVEPSNNAQENRNEPVQRRADLQPPTALQPHKGRLATDPARQDEVEAILDLAALLSWRGQLQTHMSALIKICQMALDQVQAEVSLRLQAFAQMGIPKKELWARVIARARRSDHPGIIAFIDAITTSGPRTPKVSPVVIPKHSIRDRNSISKR